MPDLARELQDLSQAERHIELARDRVARQRELVGALEDGGHHSGQARELLTTMESVLDTFEAHRETILEAVATARRGLRDG